MQDRHLNHGLRKICDCPRRRWAKCPHGWHFNFKWQATHHRYSLDRLVGEHVESKTAAEQWCDTFRDQIRSGTFRGPASSGAPAPPSLEELTLRHLLNDYVKRYVTHERPGTLDATTSEAEVICRTRVDGPDGEARPLGDWRADDVKVHTIRRFKAARSKFPVAANRNLALLRACFAWALEEEIVSETPFKKREGGKLTIAFNDETPRDRRLDADEADRLLAAAGTHLRALVEAAIETGCRKGELLSLQWSQVHWTPRAELHLPASKTKTGTPRIVPISTRLKSILEMRQTAPDDTKQPPEAFVFGSEIGTRVTTVKTAWRLALKRAKITDLHFHDLRREAGSRWLDGGVPLQVIQRWLGHANISQTSTYLGATDKQQHEAMRQYEIRLHQLATDSKTGGRKSPRPAARTDKKPRKTAIGLH